jgi:hypothetical protein
MLGGGQAPANAAPAKAAQPGAGPPPSPAAPANSPSSSSRPHRSPSAEAAGAASGDQTRPTGASAAPVGAGTPAGGRG